MAIKDNTSGLREVREARAESRSLYWAVAIFSVFANLLMLTGPLYMLRVYDRVLASRSVETLVGLTVLMLFLYFIMGVLDHARGRIMARVGARFQSRMDQRVFDAVMRKSAVRPDAIAASGLRDLESVQKLMTSPALLALYDVPWTPIFVFAIFIFHPWMGYLAVAGGLILVAVTVLNQAFSRIPLTRAAAGTIRAETMGEQIRVEAEMVQAMGMRDAAFTRWQQLRDEALTQHIAATDVGGGFSSITKTFRLLLQSAMLGLGAWLVLRGEMSPGAMIAGSILMGRALAPIEMLVGQWAIVQRATKGWTTLSQLLSEVPPEGPRTPLPRPQSRLDVQQVTLVPPGEQQAWLRMVSFTLEPGQAIGVIGPSGTGKSSLARALTGVWRPAGGKIRLDGATLDQYDPAVLGNLIGYLPQRVQLFDGSIADNIARMSPTPDPEAVVAAAKKAAAHDMILNCRMATTPASRRMAGGCRAGRCSASALRAPCTATRRFWFWTSRTRTSTMTAVKR